MVHYDGPWALPKRIPGKQGWRPLNGPIQCLDVVSQRLPRILLAPVKQRIRKILMLVVDKNLKTRIREISTIQLVLRDHKTRPDSLLFWQGGSCGVFLLEIPGEETLVNVFSILSAGEDSPPASLNTAMGLYGWGKGQAS